MEEKKTVFLWMLAQRYNCHNNTLEWYTLRIERFIYSFEALSHCILIFLSFCLSTVSSANERKYPIVCNIKVV